MVSIPYKAGVVIVSTSVGCRIAPSCSKDLHSFFVVRPRLDDSGSSKCSSASKPLMDPHDLVINKLL